MNFTDFLHQNIVLFVAGAGILAFLITTEIRHLKTRGATLTSTKLTQKVNAGALLIDLRRTDDFRNGHIAGARNIHFEDLANHIASLGDKADPIVLYCYNGNLSSKAISQLNKQGFSNVMHLGGGIATWKNDNLPLNKA